MRRIQSLIWRSSAIVVWLSSCVVTIEPDPHHCMHNDGNAFCVEQHTKKIRPYCGYASCYAAYPDGCVGTPPVDAACYSPCGGGKSLAEDPSCELPVMTTAAVRDPAESSDTTTDTGASESTTGASETGSSSEGSSGSSEVGSSETTEATTGTGTSETTT